MQSFALHNAETPYQCTVWLVTPPWSLQLSWQQIGASTSATILGKLWQKCHMNYIKQHTRVALQPLNRHCSCGRVVSNRLDLHTCILHLCYQTASRLFKVTYVILAVLTLNHISIAVMTKPLWHCCYCWYNNTTQVVQYITWNRGMVLYSLLFLLYHHTGNPCDLHSSMPFQWA